MSPKSSKEITPSQSGVFYDLALRIKLILRLIADRRVNLLLKILPVGSLLYWLVPDLVPGPIDDALVTFVGMYLFVELCPTEVVEEHLRDLKGVISANWRNRQAEEDVVDAEFHEIEGDPQDDST